MVQEGEVASITYQAANDSTESDSINTVQPVYGIILTPPEAPENAPHRPIGDGVSFILGGLFLLFLIVSLRFRNNIKYAVTMFRNVVETRTRQNVFDDTVRETSLIFLLNLLWCACAGIIGFCVFEYFNPIEIAWSSRWRGMLFGMALAGVYTLFMWWAYASVGWVFSDRNHSELWVKGFAAGQAMMTPAFFITALLGICRPDTAFGVGIASGIIFIFAKLLFIWKGYRIFFSQISSWVLFLCYLCSLEIVPLILCYRCAVLLGEEL